MRRRTPCLLTVWASLLLVGPHAHAEDPPKAASRPDVAAEKTPPEGAAAAPEVSLDRLLKLPSSLSYSAERRGGATRGEWRDRFQHARQSIVAEREALSAARGKLDKAAAGSDAWQVGPPIPGAANPGETPVDFQLRQEIRRRREDLARLERELRDLEVEANLAQVPEDWRE